MLKILVISFTLLASGCTSSTGHMYSADGTCLTCWNNPLTGEAVNHDGGGKSANSGSTNKQKNEKKYRMPGKYQPYTLNLTSPVSVDIAFLKIKREFEFQTAEEIHHEWGDMAEVKLGSSGFAFDSMPSIYYHMSAPRSVGGQRMNIEFLIEKRTETSSAMKVTYWPRSKSLSPEKIEQAIRNRISKALGPF